MASPTRVQIVVLAVLAVSSGFVSASRRELKQGGTVSEAEEFAQKWLAAFLEEAAVARFGVAPTPAPEEVLDMLDPDFLFEDYEDTEDASTNYTAIEIDPWNPPCVDPSLPVLKLEGKTFHDVDKEIFSVYVPAEYEVLAWAVSRVHSPELEDGVTAIRDKTGGLDFTIEVGDRTNRNITVCGSWVYSESAVYTWALYVDKDAEMDVFYTYRPHNNNGAAAKVFGSYLDQKINFSGGTAALVGGNRNIVTSNYNSDLQERDTGNDWTVDNRVKGDANEITQDIFVGQKGYILQGFQGK